MTEQVLSLWLSSIGVTMLLAAFFLSIFKKIAQESLSYSILNIVGAGLACYASALIDFWPFVVLEGVWAAVAVVALARTMRGG